MDYNNVLHMTELRTYPTKMDINKGIGRATQINSQMLDSKYGCVPTAIAFTHEYTQAEIQAGLVPRPTLGDVTRGASYMAKKFGQELLRTSTTEIDLFKFTEQLTGALENATSAWILYFENDARRNFVGHMISVVSEGPRQFRRWDLDNLENKIKRITSIELAKDVNSRRLESFPDVFIFSFLKD